MPAHNIDFFLEVAMGLHAGYSTVNKYGRNPDIDTASNFEALWSGGGDYTGQDATAAETLEVFSGAAADAGTLLSSGTSTGGSHTTLEDSGATFSTDTVAVADVIINDTRKDHAIVTAVTETKLTFVVSSMNAQWGAGDAYRVATKASTGAPVLKLNFLLDGGHKETEEYIILNGASGVDTVGTYIRQSRGSCHGGTNAGTLTVRQKTTTANISMVMPIGYNKSMIAAYTIPDGKSAFAFHWFGALAKKQAAFSNIRLMFRPVGDVFQVAEELTVASTGTSYVDRVYVVPKHEEMHTGTDIKIMADASADNLAMAGGFDLVLVDV